jgi:primosomal protein N' (replication factor Y)
VDGGPGQADQLALIGPRGGILPRAVREAAAPGAGAPVVQVVIDSPLRRLDREFDYLVPPKLEASARFGMRVRVPFGGRRMDGFIVGTAPAGVPAHDLAAVHAVVGTLPALTPASLALCRAVAAHYAGTLPDVLRLAVPPRHAKAEAGIGDLAAPLLVPPPGPGERLEADPGRWAWRCPGGTDWASVVARSLTAAAAEGGRALAVVPDGRDLRRLVAALSPLAPQDCVAVLSGGGTPALRWAHYLRAATGAAPIVVGTRSAAFAPIADPSLIVLWDDGDDSHGERRAPYPHAREVLGLRSTGSQAFVVGSYGRSPNVQRWVGIGWARELPGPRPRTGRVLAARAEDARVAPGPRSARVPPQASAAIRDGLQRGPVLVSVARRGYLPTLACRTCREPARCPACSGPLAMAGPDAPPTCQRCGRAAVWVCPHCGDDRLRSVSVGSARTAEELGRAFPGVPVVASAGDRISDEVPARPAVVVATPGAEPVAEGGYTAVVLLDVEAALALPGLRTAEHAARRWFAAVGLARADAPVVVVAAGDLPVVQALLRQDPAWLARRELAERAAAGMPPAAKAVEAVGPRESLDALRGVLPPSAVVLGPVPVEQDRERILVTVEPRRAGELLQVLRERMMSRSAAGAAPVVLRVDPVDLL